MSKTLLRGALVVLALAGLAAVMAHLAGMFHETLPTDPVAVAVTEPAGELFTAAPVSETVVEQAAGTLRAKNETVVAARILATVSAIPVRAGDRVSQGEVLVELDSRELAARVEQQEQAVAAATARLAEARANYDRILPLAERGVASRSELDRAEAALRTAEAERARAQRMTEEARTALSYSTLLAPISGRVEERYAEPGDTVSPGQALLKIYDPQLLRLEAPVRESLAAGLERGQVLQVHVDALNEIFSGVVDEVVPAADPGARAFLVKVTLPLHPRLYPGMFGRLLLPVGEVERLYLPAAALARAGQLEFVTVVDDGVPVRRYVRSGRVQEDGRVEILSGLSAGEQVLLPGGPSS